MIVSLKCCNSVYAIQLSNAVVKPIHYPKPHNYNLEYFAYTKNVKEANDNKDCKAISAIIAISVIAIKTTAT